MLLAALLLLFSDLCAGCASDVIKKRTGVSGQTNNGALSFRDLVRCACGESPTSSFTASTMHDHCTRALASHHASTALRDTDVEWAFEEAIATDAAHVARIFVDKVSKDNKQKAYTLMLVAERSGEIQELVSSLLSESEKRVLRGEVEEAQKKCREVESVFKTELDSVAAHLEGSGLASERVQPLQRQILAGRGLSAGALYAGVVLPGHSLHAAWAARLASLRALHALLRTLPKPVNPYHQRHWLDVPAELAHYFQLVSLDGLLALLKQSSLTQSVALMEREMLSVIGGSLLDGMSQLKPFLPADEKMHQVYGYSLSSIEKQVGIDRAGASRIHRIALHRLLVQHDDVLSREFIKKAFEHVASIHCSAYIESISGENELLSREMLYRAIPVGHTRMLYGGISGHAVSVEVTRQDSDLYRRRIFNSGNGRLRFHQMHAEDARLVRMQKLSPEDARYLIYAKASDLSFADMKGASLHSVRSPSKMGAISIIYNHQRRVDSVDEHAALYARGSGRESKSCGSMSIALMLRSFGPDGYVLEGRVKVELISMFARQESTAQRRLIITEGVASMIKDVLALDDRVLRKRVLAEVEPLFLQSFVVEGLQSLYEYVQRRVHSENRLLPVAQKSPPDLLVQTTPIAKDSSRLKAVLDKTIEACHVAKGAASLNVARCFAALSIAAVSYANDRHLRTFIAHMMATHSRTTWMAVNPAIAYVFLHCAVQLGDVDDLLATFPFAGVLPLHYCPDANPSIVDEAGCPALEHLEDTLDFERLAACIHRLHGPLASTNSLQKHLFSNSHAVVIPLYSLLQWIRHIQNAPASWWSALFGKAMASYAEEPHTHYLFVSAAIQAFDRVAALTGLLPFSPDLSFVSKNAPSSQPQEQDTLRIHNSPRHRLKAARQAYARQGSLSQIAYKVLESKGSADFLAILGIFSKHRLILHKTESSVVTSVARRAIESGQERLWVDAMRVFKFRVTSQIKGELLKIAATEPDGAVGKAIKQMAKPGILRSKTIII